MFFFTDTCRLDIFTHTPCTAITPPTSTTSFYIVQTPRGNITARHVIHATNGWSSHLLPGLRSKIVPFRALVTAQRPGTGLSTPPDGTRAHIFYYSPTGFDFLTQLPTNSQEGEGEGGELLFGGGATQGGRIILSEVGVADDSKYDLDIASHVEGALPECFGRANWGAESVVAATPVPTTGSRETGEEGFTWDSGRIKAMWTGIVGISADLQPWVGRVPPVISGRAAPAPSHRRISEKGGTTAAMAAAGEWVSAGYSGEGMTNAWLCAHALALMVLGVEEEERMHMWFPDEFRLTEKRWRSATIERILDRF
jgi:glycine/D-amino acid oxidase-like deaminating enzyme